METYNFSAGPAVLPKEVLEKAKSEFRNYQGTGMSVMEISHRSGLFEDILNKAIEDLRDLLEIPENYKVLFLQGGASTQFAMVPLNLFVNKEADFIITGNWSKKAYTEASKFGQANVVADSSKENFTCIPDCSDLDLSGQSDYIHFCANNTIYGTKFNTLPDAQGKDLVVDASSCLLSEPIDVSDFGLIYASAQKNLGPAGVTVVIIREDLLERESAFPIPTMLSYQTHAKKNSAYNTPPTYAIYIMGLVFQWLKDLGGLKEMKKINKEKAQILYDYIGQSELFTSQVRKEDRSLMNIPFLTGNEDVDKTFIKEAEDHGLYSLKGHRSVGGMRASLYNAMPLEGVQALVNFMDQFERK